MKNSITFILLAINIFAFAQSPTQNYIKNVTYLAPSTQAINENDTLVNVTYFDGLGRQLQTVNVGAGGNKQDIVTPFEYDKFGRQTKQYLPHANSSQTISSPNYRNNETVINGIKSLYQQKFPEDVLSQSVNAYNETFYENSPLSRVLKQAAPGKNWIADTISNTDHTIKFVYETNKAFEVRKFDVGFINGNFFETELLCTSTYKANQLYKKIIKNENWIAADGVNNTTEEFTDKEGRLILKRGFNSGKKHDTFYVYDKFNNLTYVIPPMASDAVITDNFTIQTLNHNSPWVKLVAVSQSTSSAFLAETAGIPNSDILNVDLQSKYGGKGGFSLVPDESGTITLNLNIATSVPTEYKTGIIADLTDMGTYADKELGRLEGIDYSYIFSIKGNMIEVTGYGKVPSINRSFNGGQKLEYSQNYPWTKLCIADAQIVDQYETAIKDLDNSAILTTYVPNDYSASGGVAISIDEFDTITLSFNINSTVPMDLTKGTAFPLDIQRSISDRTLGTVSGSGYSYEFSIKNNTLYINGFGKITNLTTFFSQLTRFQYIVNEKAVKAMCYIYHYDKRNRVVQKHIPDNGWTHIVYDKLDRLVLSQDENLRLKKQWLFTKYDKLDRVAITGLCDDNRTRATLQDFLDQHTDFDRNVVRTGTATKSLPGNISLFYDEGTTFPTPKKYYSIQYYDEYLPFDPGNIPASVYDVNLQTAKSLPTVNYVNVLNDTGDSWVTNIQGYDFKARQIWNKSVNSYLGTEDVTEIKLDFTGRTLETWNTHIKDGNNMFVIDQFEYDKIRLIKHKQGVNFQYPQLIAHNKYDELGQLIQKKVGGNNQNSISYDYLSVFQTIDYTYNIRGWLKSINNPSSLGNDLFAFKIGYDNLYNGNISSTQWKSTSDNNISKYEYQYDELNRLTNSVSSNGSSINNYNEGNITYDKNGNILTLQRLGLKANSTYGMIDDLSYIYKPFSNQLLKVADYALDAEGFKDGNKGDQNDYRYDDAGNLKKDLNKGIGVTLEEEITYNHLNLPVKVTVDANNYIIYTYDTSGRKLQKQVNINGGITKTDYANGFIYENNALQYFSHPEGYARKETNGNFTYVYQYKDHLGNVRLSYADTNGDGSISESSFNEGFEDGVSNWGGIGSNTQLELDSTISRSGKYSAKITSPGPDGRYSKCGVWMDINNSTDTYYTYTVYIKSNKPNAEIVLFMKTAEETGFYTSIDSYAYHGYMTQWTKLEKTILVPANIKKLSLRLDTNADGTVWFDDVSIKRADGQSEIIEESNYYPFGLKHENLNNVAMSTNIAQKIKYNGKELQDELGLDWYDMEARNYMPDVGRWGNIDELAEAFEDLSPYNFSNNNPINFSDPTGLSPEGVNHIASTFVKNGKVVEHRNDGDNNVYEVGNKWKPGDSKGGLTIIGKEVPGVEYKVGYRVNIFDGNALAFNPNHTIQPVGGAFDITGAWETFFTELFSASGTDENIETAVAFAFLTKGKRNPKIAFRVLPLLLKSGKLHKHHVLSQQFRKWFASRGIKNIDDFTVQISAKNHLNKLHAQGKWNQQWAEFIKQNPNATPSQIFYQAESMLKSFGLEHAKYVKYK